MGEGGREGKMAGYSFMWLRNDARGKEKHAGGGGGGGGGKGGKILTNQMHCSPSANSFHEVVGEEVRK